MGKYDNQYLISSGKGDNEYGLYIIKNGVVDKSTGNSIAYFYDGDEFLDISDDEMKYFVKPSELNSCKDEYDDSYTDKALAERIVDAIKEYDLRINAYLDAADTMNQMFLEAEAKAREEE